MSSFEIVVAEKYQLGGLISSGDGIDLFEAQNIHSGERVALKMEHKRHKQKKTKQESLVLEKLQGALGIPLKYWYGLDGDYSIISLEILGKDLEFIKDNYSSGTFSLKTTLMLAD